MAGVRQGRLQVADDAANERGYVTRRLNLAAKGKKRKQVEAGSPSESFADTWFTSAAVLDTILAYLGPSWLLAGGVCKRWREAVLTSDTSKRV
jgi:hypothetical protein